MLSLGMSTAGSLRLWVSSRVVCIVISLMTIIQIFLGVLDDGRGRARVGLFRHKHEIETGRTSSVGMEVSITPDNYLFS